MYCKIEAVRKYIMLKDNNFVNRNLYNKQLEIIIYSNAWPGFKKYKHPSKIRDCIQHCVTHKKTHVKVLFQSQIFVI